MFKTRNFSRLHSSYFNICTPNTHLLVSRLISENFVEIGSQVPEISSILEYAGGVAPRSRRGNILKEFFTYYSSPK